MYDIPIFAAIARGVVVLLDERANNLGHGFICSGLRADNRRRHTVQEVCCDTLNRRVQHRRGRLWVVVARFHAVPMIGAVQFFAVVLPRPLGRVGIAKLFEQAVRLIDKLLAGLLR